MRLDGGRNAAAVLCVCVGEQRDKKREAKEEARKKRKKKRGEKLKTFVGFLAAPRRFGSSRLLLVDDLDLVAVELDDVIEGEHGDLHGHLAALAELHLLDGASLPGVLLRLGKRRRSFIRGCLMMEYPVHNCRCKAQRSFVIVPFTPHAQFALDTRGFFNLRFEYI